MAAGVVLLVNIALEISVRAGLLPSFFTVDYGLPYEGARVRLLGEQRSSGKNANQHSPHIFVSGNSDAVWVSEISQKAG